MLPAMAGKESPELSSRVRSVGLMSSRRFPPGHDSAAARVKLVPVVSVAPAGRADVFDLDVDHPDHAFTVNGGIVVHNCYDALRYCLSGMDLPEPRVTRMRFSNR